MKHRLYALKSYFSKGELLLWGASVLFVLLSFAVFDGEHYLNLTASLIGVTSLIFCAKGNPFGQFLMILFSLLYGLISLSFSYYGEMMTYLGMTMPMAIFSFLSWLKNPYNGNASEVEVYHVNRRDLTVMTVLTVIVTVVFYFILKGFHTSNLIPSTISVTTSFLAVFLTFKRSPFYAVGYAANDLILIVLWSMAAMENAAYASVVVCFAAFLINDLYGFINWNKMGKRQAQSL